MSVAHPSGNNKPPLFTESTANIATNSGMNFDQLEINPISSSERRYLRSKKHYNRKRHNGSFIDPIDSKAGNSNGSFSTHKNQEQLNLLTILDNDDELTSFPLAPPPSNSISNMDQILNDTSNIDISFEINTNIPLNNTSNPPNQKTSEDPKLKVSRKDPIVLIEDYISNEGLSSTPQSSLARKKSSVYTLKRSLFDLKAEMTSHSSYSHLNSLFNNTSNNTIFEDSFRATYTSIQSLKSFNSIKKLKSIKSKSSLQYLNNAIFLLQNSKKNQQGPLNNITTTFSQVLNGKQPSVSSSDTLNPTLISSANTHNNLHVSSLTNSATSSQNTAVLPTDHLQFDVIISDFDENQELHNGGEEEDGEIGVDRCAIETSSRNNSFTSVNNHALDEHMVNSPKISNNFLPRGKEGTLKYCTICDKPLYDLSSLISDDKVFKVFVCDNCTFLYNDIIFLLDKFFLEIDIASRCTSTDVDSDEYLVNNISEASTLSKRKQRFESSQIDEDLFDEDEQLLNLAKFVAIELGDSNNKYNENEMLNQNTPDVAIYEKLLKLLLLVMHSHQETINRWKPEDVKKEKEKEDEDIHHNTTTDIGDDSVHTLSLHPEAGFSTQNDVSNILDELYEENGLATYSPRKKKEEQQEFLFNTSFSDINNIKNGYAYQTSKMDLCTEAIHSSVNKEQSLDMESDSGCIDNTKLKFLNALIGLLHDQLSVYDSHGLTISGMKASPQDFGLAKPDFSKNSGTDIPDLGDTGSLAWEPRRKFIEDELSKIRKKIRWRWRIKGLLPGLDPVDRFNC